MTSQVEEQTIEIKNELGETDQIIGKQKRIVVQYGEDEQTIVAPGEDEDIPISIENDVNLRVTPGAPRNEKTKIIIKSGNLRYEFHMWLDRAWDLTINKVPAGAQESTNVTIGQEEDG